MKLNTTKRSLLDIIKSVAASAIGVQSSANRERDFEQNSVVPYVVVGVVFVVIFVLTLAFVVSLVLPS